MSAISVKNVQDIGRKSLIESSFIKRIIFLFSYNVEKLKIKRENFIRRKTFYSVKESQQFHEKYLDSRIKGGLKDFQINY